VVDAARRVGFTAGRKGLPEDRLTALEEAGGELTDNQVARFADVYRRPVLTFYLAKPPPRGERGEDFRTLPEQPDPSTNSLVDSLVRDIRTRQSLVGELRRDEDALRLKFVGSTKITDGIEAARARVADAIEWDVTEFRRAQNVGSSFDLLRRKVEAAGVFVVLIGDLGSHHTAIDVKVFRGFALADPIAPFIVINDQDAKVAWSFTLLHELVHLFLGRTGVSGGPTDAPIERFCNDVASALLLAPVEVQQLALPADVALAQAAINEFARARRISRPLVLYRLYTAGRITEARWRQMSAAFEDEYRRERAAMKERNRASEGGPSYYVVRRHRLGDALLGLVDRALQEGTITRSKAGRVLGVKPRNVDTLVAGRAA